MCQPCRAELYTGLYPMRNGCAWNHSASRPDVTRYPPKKLRLPPNLADTPKTREAGRRTDRWMAAQQDPGAPQDTLEALQASRKGRHLYGVAP